MRELKITSLVFLAGLAIAACSSSDGGDDDNNTGAGGSGVGNMPGAGGDTTGSTGGSNTGTGGGSSASACEGEVVTATGTPALIDDFEGDPADGLPENDSRAGEWHFGSYTDTAGPLAVFDDDGGNKYMRFSMENAGLEVTAWDSADPWGQWAAATTLLQLWAEPLDCYDAGVHTGIRFKAKSGKGDDKIQLQVNIPGANAEAGETHKSESVMSLGGDWETFEVPFTTIKQPSWVAQKVPFDPSAIHSIAFVVRSVQDEADGEVLGESLLDFDIWIDDVEFY